MLEREGRHWVLVQMMCINGGGKSVGLDINAFAFTTHKECLGVVGDFCAY